MSNNIFHAVHFRGASYGGCKSSILYYEILIHSDLFKVFSVPFDRYALQIVIILEFVEIIH